MGERLASLIAEPLDIPSGSGDLWFVGERLSRSPVSSAKGSTLTNDAGVGLLATGMPLMEASASHYSAADLYQAIHTCDLVRRAETILNLDHKQSGLGGASCGPGTLPQYLIQPGAFQFSFRLRPFNADTDSPAELARSSPFPLGLGSSPLL